MESNLADVV